MWSLYTHSLLEFALQFYALLCTWETETCRLSTLLEILELEGSAMNLKDRSVSKTQTFNHCTALLYLLHVNLCEPSSRPKKGLVKIVTNL